MTKPQQQQSKRNAYFENARFFRYLPERSSDSLNEMQRRDIAHTIFELQRTNPRILQEIYLDNPFVSQRQSSRFWRRLQRRFYLIVRSIWYTLVMSEIENRRDNRLADMLFFVILTVLGISMVLGLGFSLYILKSAAGIDLFNGVHLFCVD